MKSRLLAFQAQVRKRWEYLRAYLIARPFVAAILFILISWHAIAFFVLLAEGGAEGKNINNLQDAIWWGIVTMLTVGYGDKYPVTFEGRFLGGILMTCGVVGIAVVTAKISSFFLERALRERRGFVDSSTLKNHFIICGWKDEMANFVQHILDSNKNLKASDIVLLNNVNDSEIESLLSMPSLKGLKIIKGEYHIEIHLRRAVPEKASKVLLLADATPGPSGEIPTITEADARTIMTAMTLNNIAKGTPVAAEILDSAMDQYLRLANVNEVIYSRDYSRMLLAMASTGTGVTNVLHDLLSPHSPYFIGTKEIPDHFINQPYKNLEEYFEEGHKMSVIGVLENSGNSHIAKEKAIRRAQQTPNISELVKNLQSVKALRFNLPHFNPSSDYIVKEGSMAIVIEHRGEEAS